MMTSVAQGSSEIYRSNARQERPHALAIKAIVDAQFAIGPRESTTKLSSGDQPLAAEFAAQITPAEQQSPEFRSASSDPPTRQP
jgi:hypothetical protein